MKKSEVVKELEGLVNYIYVNKNSDSSICSASLDYVLIVINKLKKKLEEGNGDF